MAKKKVSLGSVDAESRPATKPTRSATSTTTSSNSSLIICRNKHWKYISSFHGPWLQLPTEILESLAHQNWTMPSPRLIDPAVFFDLVKIRKYVDEAAYDSVRASTGISNTAMSGRMDYFGAGGGPSSQLSKERIFKIRQKAVGLLAKAFTLDEIAASVATMQATSTVEDVAQHVLKREASNHAKYVHFFHEKIPSRAMEQHTTTQPLTDIISALPWEEQAAPLRTRALTQTFKQQYEAAAMDLTVALRIVEELKRVHKPDQQQLELASKMRTQQGAWQKGYKDWRSIPHLKDEEQPQSLEVQLLFNRAGVYLALACQSVQAALDGLSTSAESARLDARKKVKTNARRALKDYMAFLSHFEYTPGLPFEITNEIMSRVYDLAQGKRSSGSSVVSSKERLRQSDSSEEEHDNRALIKVQRSKPNASDKGEEGWSNFPMPKIYQASMLFTERPPSDLPPLFDDKTEQSPHTEMLNEALGRREAVTYHPLLTEALHSLLLAHTLSQTSPAEMQRHAYNVARLARIADGYPIFQPARSSARADWIEVLKETKGWLHLASSWPVLCATTPLPEAAGGWVKNNAVAKPRPQAKPEEDAEQKRQRIKQESILEALSDERVVDEETFQQAVQAREDRSAREESKEPYGNAKALPACSDADQSTKHSADSESCAMYPISSQRAQAIARWVLEAPLSIGTKKKRPARKKKATAVAGSDANVLVESVGTLSIDHDDNEVD